MFNFNQKNRQQSNRQTERQTAEEWTGRKTDSRIINRQKTDSRVIDRQKNRQQRKRVRKRGENQCKFAQTTYKT